MALRTKCMECETSSERKEPYLDISVAIRKRGETADSDDEDDADNQGGTDIKKQWIKLRSLSKFRQGPMLYPLFFNVSNMSDEF